MFDKEKKIIDSYELAKEKYNSLGVDVELALTKLKEIAISIHCWQGDDVCGFENKIGLSGGIQATGNYIGKARTPEELRKDIEHVLSLVPGKHRLALHMIYAEPEQAVDRSKLEPKHFQNWADWGKKHLQCLDLNPTLFSHDKANDGLTLSHPNKDIRDYWIEHVNASRKIAAYFGKEFGTPSVNNVWIPDGFKDITIDKYSPRKRLMESLDKIFENQYDERYLLDSVESKLFGIGSEAYVVGSNEFYLGYAATRKKLLCLDVGHFHPTEVISAKISSCLLFIDKLMLHVSRPVRWDSDHVVIFEEEIIDIAREIIRHDFLGRVYIGLDFFDASINRIAAWTIGARSMIKALLAAMLEPTKKLVDAEHSFDFTTRLALFEEMKTYPFGSVWDYYCLKEGVPVGETWLTKISEYEKEVLSKRV